MTHYDEDTIRHVKQMDLLTYLMRADPYELIRAGPDTYSTRTHDSLKISNGKWCWWSHSIGGRSALDYLIKVKGMAFPEAVKTILDLDGVKSPIILPAQQPKKVQFVLPKKNSTDFVVRRYLSERCIDERIFGRLIEKGLIYENHEGRGHFVNAVFVGIDGFGEPKYAHIRGIGTDFKGDAQGSDKRYSFSIPAERPSQTIHVFESAIDLLSFATIEMREQRKYSTVHLLSCSGIYKPGQTKSTVPIALSHYLKCHPVIKCIKLHLDNDYAGKLAAKTIISSYKDKYVVSNLPAREGNDMNDYLRIKYPRARPATPDQANPFATKGESRQTVKNEYLR